MNYRTLALGLLLVLGLFVFGCVGPSVPNDKGNSTQVGGSEAYTLYFSYSSNTIPSEYYYKYSESVNGVNKTVTIAKGNRMVMVKIDDIVWDRAYYIGENDSVFGCVALHDPVLSDARGCRNLTDIVSTNAHVEDDYKRIVNYPFSNRKMMMEDVFYHKLYKMGVMKFGDVGACTWKNNTYYKLTFTIQYKDLTLQQLKELGINPETLPDEVNATYCVDKDGFRLSKSITQIWAGVPKIRWFMTVDNYTTKVPEGVFDPEYANNISKIKFKVLFNRGLEVYTKYSRAMIQYEDVAKRDGALRTLAFDYRNPMFCNLLSDSGEKDVCFVSSAADIGSPKVCEIAPDSAKDGCYLEVAHKQMNETYCSYILNDSKRSVCIGIFNTTTNETSDLQKNETEADVSGGSDGTNGGTNSPPSLPD